MPQTSFPRYPLIFAESISKRSVVDKWRARLYIYIDCIEWGVGVRNQICLCQNDELQNIHHSQQREATAERLTTALNTLTGLAI